MYDRRKYFMINLHESMGPVLDQTRDPWVCSQTRICCQKRYRLRYEARFKLLKLISLMTGASPFECFPVELKEYNTIKNGTCNTTLLSEDAD